MFNISMLGSFLFPDGPAGRSTLAKDKATTVPKPRISTHARTSPAIASAPCGSKVPNPILINMFKAPTRLEMRHSLKDAVR